MEEKHFAELYDVQRRIKNDKILSDAMDNAIDPEIAKYDGDISELLFNLQLANRSIWTVLHREKGISISEELQKLPVSFLTSPNTEIYGQIKATLKNFSSKLHEKASSAFFDAFCTIPSVFQYLWCDESIEDFVRFLFEASSSEFSNLVQSLVTNPLICSYFRAALQPFFDRVLSLSLDQSISFAKQSLLDFSELIPEFFIRILRREDSPSYLFWAGFLATFLKFPFLFGLCSLEFEIYHKDILTQFITSFESFFSTPESAKFMNSLLSARPAVLYPSSHLFEEVCATKGGRFLFSPEDSALLGSFVEFPESHENTMFLQKPVIPPPKPFSALPEFIDVVIKLLGTAKLIMPETQGTTKAALTQIVELGAPQLTDELDLISDELAKLTIPELCNMINMKLAVKEESGRKRILGTIARYSSQASLVQMYTNSAKMIYSNAQVLAFIENPDTPKDIPTSRAAATLKMFKDNLDCFSKPELDQETNKIYGRDLVESTDAFILKCKRNQSELQFFADEINLIVKGEAPLEIAGRIITAMGWLSEFVFSSGEEEAGADCIVPLTILAITVAKPSWLASIISLLEDFILPAHQTAPIFSHTEFFFLSTFACAGGYIISKVTEAKS